MSPWGRARPIHQQTTNPLAAPAGSSSGTGTTIIRLLSVLALLFVFLIGVKGLGSGFKLLGGDLHEQFFAVTSNPLVALMVGILVTTLMQSSSVSTSMIVALVAAPDSPLPMESAVPMIMGANIGTTVTNTIVSLAHMGRPDEFRRAFAVATCHDYFNYLAVAIFLPLELMTGYLQRSATALAGLFGEVGGVTYKSPLKTALSTALHPIKEFCHNAFESQQAQGVLLGLISGVLIYVALLLLVKVMRKVMESRVEVFINRFLGSSALLSIFVGIVVTVSVQSSSITTSLLVPMAGAGMLTLRHAFPVTLGANIGTTVTALLASLAASGPNAHLGLVIAFVHLLFNLSATMLIYPIAPIRNIPLRLAEGMANFAVRSRGWALAYVLFLFYGVPAMFAVIGRMLD